MRIVILGAGQVGTSVAQSLLSESNDITVVDTDEPRLAYLHERLDLRTVAGNAVLPSVLQSAGLADADMLIALTQSDQTNLVACKLAHSIFNVPTRIARLRSSEFLDNGVLLADENFAVSYALCPEQVITDYLVKLVEFQKPCRCYRLRMGAWLWSVCVPTRGACWSVARSRNYQVIWAVKLMHGSWPCSGRGKPFFRRVKRLSKPETGCSCWRRRHIRRVMVELRRKSGSGQARYRSG